MSNANGWILNLVNIPMFFIVFLIGWLMPYLTRREIVFGVRLNGRLADSPDVRELKRDYLRDYGIAGGFLAILLSMGYILLPDGDVRSAIMLGSLLQVAVMFLYFLHFRKKAGELKTRLLPAPEGRPVVVADTAYRDSEKALSWAWNAIPLVLLAASFAFGLSMYDLLPERIPMHWDLQGNVDGWSRKTHASVLFLPIVMTFCSGLMLMVFWVIRSAKQNLDAERPKESLEQNHAFRFHWSVFTVISHTALILGMLPIYLHSLRVYAVSQGLAFAAIGGSVLFIVVYAIVLSIKVGQGGSRLDRQAVETRFGLTNRDDDRLWRAGVFYVNPDDPALWVEKRFGVGWTLNFGNPRAWYWVAGFVVICLGLVGFSLYVSIFNAVQSGG